MNKIVIVLFTLFFSNLSAQTFEDRFRMVIVESRFSDSSNSLSNSIKRDPRFSKIFVVETEISDSLESPRIEIYAPDGFKMGTCFMAGALGGTYLSYYQELEKYNRIRWTRIKTLPSYQLYKNPKNKG